MVGLATLLAVAWPHRARNAASAAEAAAEVPAGLSSAIVDHTLIVTAGHERSMTLAGTPGEGRGPTIRCGWFGFTADSPEGVDIYQVFDPVVGEYYILYCWYLADLGMLPGYPLIVPYELGVPGEAADADDVSEYALASMDFVDPQPVLNPVDVHVVGVESWLAITSRLDYDAIHANAGPVWVSVRPRFRKVEWDLGNGDSVSCTQASDATLVWQPDDPDRSSDCTYLYEATGAFDGRHEITATVTWTILRRTFEQPAWRAWRDFSLTTTVSIRVVDLQAVID